MKRLSELRLEWQSVPGEKRLTGLLKHLFAVLDNEVANSRQFGEFVSLDAPVEPDAQDVASHGGKEIFNFISPMTPQAGRYHR